MPLFRALCIAALASLASGCLEGTEKITLNPDGSGKAVMDLYILTAPGDPRSGGPDGLSPQAVARLDAQEIVQELKGVDAWSDVSFEVAKDGRTHFKGTAFFPSLEKFGLLPIDERDQFKVRWDKDPAGGMVFTFRTPQAGRLAGEPLGDAQIAERMKEMRESWAHSKKSEDFAELARFKIVATLLLPGEMDQSAILEKVPGGARVSFEGQKLIDGMDKIVGDDASLKSIFKAGGAIENEDLFLQAVFGKKGPIRAHVAGELKPSFDYAAEAAAARKAQPEMLKKTGLADDANAPPTTAPAPPPH